MSLMKIYIKFAKIYLYTSIYFNKISKLLANKAFILCFNVY